MTTNTPDREAAEQLEIQAGRRAPFTMTPDWVLLAPISRNAKTLYWALKAHVNQQRGDTEVWPTQDQLGQIIGYSSRKDVRECLDELVNVDAIERRTVRTHGGMRPRTIYTVHETVPPGWSGPESLGDFYRSLKEESSQVTPNVPTQGHSNVPTQGHSNVPTQGRWNVPARGQELDELEPDQQQQDEVEIETDSLRSSVPRTHTREAAAADDEHQDADERTEEVNSKKEDERAEYVLGCLVTAEHRTVADDLAADIDTDPLVSELLTKNADMRSSQRRKLKELLPRAVAVAGGNADQVRGYLVEKAREARTASYVLAAFDDDEYLADVQDAEEVAPAEERQRRAEQQQREREERQQRVNRHAEAHWGYGDPWAPRNTNSDPFAGLKAPQEPKNGNEENEGADTVGELATASVPDWTPSPMQRGMLRSVLGDYDRADISRTLKQIHADSGTDGLGRTLRKRQTLVSAIEQNTALPHRKEAGS